MLVGGRKMVSVTFSAQYVLNQWRFAVKYVLDQWGSGPVEAHPSNICSLSSAAKTTKINNAAKQIKILSHHHVAPAMFLLDLLAAAVAQSTRPCSDSLY